MILNRQDAKAAKKSKHIYPKLGVLGVLAVQLNFEIISSKGVKNCAFC
jgi:hypothetical protein